MKRAAQLALSGAFSALLLIGGVGLSGCSADTLTGPTVESNATSGGTVNGGGGSTNGGGSEHNKTGNNLNGGGGSTNGGGSEHN